MNVLILGGGGREHTIAWKLNKSPLVNRIYASPGNAGIDQIGLCIEIDPSDFPAVKEVVLQHNIGMVVVGPEGPLVKGIVDYLNSDVDLQHVKVIGPNRNAAILEGSKAFAKDFMKKYNIPTANSISVTKETIEQGLAFLENQYPPYVLKADGLAAGKGVLIVDYQKKAESTLREMLEGQFGDASKTVVIEEYLEGIEISCFVIIDNNSYKLLPYAKDYKRIGEKGTGLNTGGMGAISPVPFVDQNLSDIIENEIIIPTINGIRQENLGFKGILFIGLIKVDGKPKVMEYNVRFGDPEAEVVIPRINNDLMELFLSITNDTVSDIRLNINPQSAATIMAVSGGYPVNYTTGEEITGLDESESNSTIIFHAGTILDKNSSILTDGGRVLSVTSFGRNHYEATERSCRRLEKIHFRNKYYRTDIGHDL